MTVTSNTRTPLSARDREILTEKLANLNSEQKILAAEISERRGVLEALEKDMEDIENQISHCKSSLTIIHTLPPELMEGIFRASITDSSLMPSSCFYYKEIREPDGEPLLPSVVSLSMVCGKWRDLVLSAPSLWSKFELNFHDWKESTLEKLSFAVQLFLDRSKNHPLTFKIGWNKALTWSNPVQLEGLDNIMSALVNNSNRWYDVSFGGGGSSVIPGTTLEPFERLAGNMRQLRYLELDLYSLPLSLIQRAFTHPDTPILDLVKLSMARSPEVIYLISNTRECIVEELLDAPLYSGEVVEGLATTMMELAVQGTRELAWILNYCKLPNLKTLEIRLWIDGENDQATVWELSSVINLFRRSNFSNTHGLKELTLYWIAVSDTEFISVLEAVPTLQVLNVHEASAKEENIHGDEDFEYSDKQNLAITAVFLKRLNRSLDENADFLPNLTTLYLTVVWEGLDQQAFVDAVTSRKPGAPTLGHNGLSLRSVTVRIASGERTDFEVLSKMEDLTGGFILVYHAEWFRRRRFGKGS